MYKVTTTVLVRMYKVTTTVLTFHGNINVINTIDEKTTENIEY